jgi:hypothetical protein
VSSGGFLLRFLVGLAGSLAAVSLVVVFAGSSQHAEGHVLGAGVTSGSWATPAELAWLEKLGSWDTRLLRGLQSAARVETTPRLAQKLMRRDGRTVVLHSRALERAGSCATDLMTTVGAPPTARLHRAFDTFRLACVHLQRFHGAITLAINHGQDSEFGTAQAEGKRAAHLLLTADQMRNGTAIKLGASPAYAAALVRMYWRHYGEELPAYRSAECGKGGKLDLGRADSIWP